MPSASMAASTSMYDPTNAGHDPANAYPKNSAATPNTSTAEISAYTV